ncbi:Phosphotransferase enzyme family protein [Ferrimonas sediminum]|uniref:Phosphotransferase enzyme family protein n=1 Tax=Ferrimonas sediminum TaxID=718193 RepID=A0A1G8VN73_9GAMM|nr:phosphotransferase [Ferrimonas sediminum]SDJ66855.1 Phosphotransferase enzyme family protein [Ferrimonas sediminum]
MPLRPETLLHRLKGYEHFSLRPFDRGSANGLFEVIGPAQETLMRVHDTWATMGVDRGREAALWHLACQQRLAPELIHWDPAHRFCVMRRWGQAADTLPPSEAISVLLAFHRLPAAPAPWDYAANLCSERWPAAKQWQAQLLASALSAGLCHHDPGRGNWLCRHGALRLIDFEYAGWGHPLWDLACLDVEWGAEVGSLVLKGYYAALGLTLNDAEYRALASARRLYLATSIDWCRQAMEQGGDLAQLQTWLSRYQQLLGACED